MFVPPFIPRTESAGRVRQSFRMLLWWPKVDRTELGRLEFIGVISDHLSSMLDSPCRIRLFVPIAFAETIGILETFGWNLETVPLQEADQKLNDAPKSPPDAELLTAVATGLAADSDVIVTYREDWFPFIDDCLDVGVLLGDVETLRRQVEIFVRGHEIPWSFEKMIYDEPW